MAKRYYAAHNPYGVNLTYSSIGWTVYAFSTKAGRDAYLEEHSYNQSGNIVSEAIARRDISQVTKGKYIIISDKGLFMDDKYNCLGEIGHDWQGIVVERL